jgi:ketosteroid isomerase-like protein
MPQFHVPQHLSGEMKMLRTLSAFAFLALMMPTMGRADDADSEKQVASLSKQFREADLKGDTEAMDALLSDDWVVIEPDGNLVSKAQNARNFKDGSVAFEAMDPSEVKVRVYGDAAVVTSRVHVKLKVKGEKVDTHVRVTEVYVRQGGKWQCVSTQVTSIAGKTGDKR